MENELPDTLELLYVLEKEAEKLNLDVFIFEKEELKNYFPFLDDKQDFAVVTIARNRSNAIYNMQNLRRTYIINDYESKYRKQQN